MIDDDLLKTVEEFNLILGKIPDSILQNEIVECCKRLLMLQGLISLSEGIRLNLSHQTAPTILGTIEKTLKDEVLD